MSVKGFFVAIACILVGGFGFWYGIQKAIEASGSPLWIAVVILSFIALFFGVGALSSRIKL